MRLFVFILAILGFALPVQAQDNPEPTRLEVDQDDNVIRVIIDGKAVAQFSSSGLMVVNDVEYGGIIKDRGSDSISEAIDTAIAPEDEGDAP